MPKTIDEDAREYYYLKGKPGKISIVPTKPMDTQRNLGLACPGVLRSQRFLSPLPDLP
jgi:hypothetical protein